MSNNINYSTHPQNLIYSKIENFIDKFHINEKHNLVDLPAGRGSGDTIVAKRSPKNQQNLVGVTKKHQSNDQHHPNLKPISKKKSQHTSACWDELFYFN